MRRKLIFTVFGLLFVLIGIHACKTKLRSQNNFNPTLILTDNVTVSGNSVTLTNNSTSQTNGFLLTFSNVGNLTCNDVSIKTTSAYGFVANESVFIPSPVEASMPQYTCEKTGSNIVLSSAPPLTEGFHPWVENFNIIFGATTFNVVVNTPVAPAQLLTRGAQNNMYLSSQFAGCGLRGTVLQRVFDCSKKIINYAVSVDATSSASGSFTTNADGTSLYYTLFANPNTDNPNLFWFVVACPNTEGSSTIPQQQCHWLTPIVPAGNPALDSTGGGTHPTFQLSILTGYQQRLLWSGKMINGTVGYNFAQSNGFLQSDAQIYSSSGIVNPGIIPTIAQPTPSPASVCNAVSGPNLYSGATFPPSDAAIRDIVSLETGATISHGSTLGWQMPSYAMDNILAGGTPTGGSSGCPVSLLGFNRPSCNIPLSTLASPFNRGFSAINVPGFSMTHTIDELPYLEILWSSSRNTGAVAWAFIPFFDSNGGYAFNIVPSFLLGVRCVSPAWY